MNTKQIQQWCIGPILTAAMGFGCADDELVESHSGEVADPGDDEGMESSGASSSEGSEDSPDPECGNGQVERDEDCDDGNAADDDACTNACMLPACGDGIVQADAGEFCDDGNAIPGDGCTVGCNLPGTVIADHTDGLFTVGHAVVVDSNDQITVLGRAKGTSWIGHLNDDMTAEWNRESLPGDPPDLAIGTNDELLIGGRVEDQARSRRIDPNDGVELWLDGVPFPGSVFSGVAIAGGHMVSVGRRGQVGSQVGLLLRHDVNTGAPMAVTVEWKDGPFGPVAVDESGSIWVIDGDKDGALLIYSSTDELVDTIGLAAGVYADIAVDADRNVYLLAHSTGKQSFTLWKYKADGSPAWQPKTYEDASASGLALAPGGAVLVAGHTSDESNGLLVWYDKNSGELVDEIVVGSEGDDGQYEVFEDIAVAQSGEFAVAVGARGLGPNNTALWVYKVEL